MILGDHSNPELRDFFLPEIDAPNHVVTNFFFRFCLIVTRLVRKRYLRFFFFNKLKTKNYTGHGLFCPSLIQFFSAKPLGVASGARQDDSFRSYILGLSSLIRRAKWMLCDWTEAKCYARRLNTKYYAWVIQRYHPIEPIRKAGKPIMRRKSAGSRRIQRAWLVEPVIANGQRRRAPWRCPLRIAWLA